MSVGRLLKGSHTIAQVENVYKTSCCNYTIVLIVTLGRFNPKSRSGFHAESDLIRFEREVEHILFGLKEPRQRQHRDTQPPMLVSSSALFMALKQPLNTFTPCDTYRLAVRSPLPAAPRDAWFTLKAHSQALRPVAEKTSARK